VAVSPTTRLRDGFRSSRDALLGSAGRQPPHPLTAVRGRPGLRTVAPASSCPDGVRLASRTVDACQGLRSHLGLASAGPSVCAYAVVTCSDAARVERSDLGPSTRWGCTGCYGPPAVGSRGARGSTDAGLVYCDISCRGSLAGLVGLPRWASVGPDRPGQAGAGRRGSACPGPARLRSTRTAGNPRRNRLTAD
jgi:hypothetical protein